MSAPRPLAPPNLCYLAGALPADVIAPPPKQDPFMMVARLVATFARPFFEEIAPCLTENLHRLIPRVRECFQELQAEQGEYTPDRYPVLTPLMREKYKGVKPSQVIGALRPLSEVRRFEGADNSKAKWTRLTRLITAFENSDDSVVQVIGGRGDGTERMRFVRILDRSLQNPTPKETLNLIREFVRDLSAFQILGSPDVPLYFLDLLLLYKNQAPQGKRMNLDFLLTFLGLETLSLRPAIPATFREIEATTFAEFVRRAVFFDTLGFHEHELVVELPRDLHDKLNPLQEEAILLRLASIKTNPTTYQQSNEADFFSTSARLYFYIVQNFFVAPDLRCYLFKLILQRNPTVRLKSLLPQFSRRQWESRTLPETTTFQSARDTLFTLKETLHLPESREEREAEFSLLCLLLLNPESGPWLSSFTPSHFSLARAVSFLQANPGIARAGGTPEEATALYTAILTALTTNPKIDPPLRDDLRLEPPLPPLPLEQALRIFEVSIPPEAVRYSLKKDEFQSWIEFIKKYLVHFYLPLGEAFSLLFRILDAKRRDIHGLTRSLQYLQRFVSEFALILPSLSPKVAAQILSAFETVNYPKSSTVTPPFLGNLKAILAAWKRSGPDLSQLYVPQEAIEGATDAFKVLIAPLASYLFPNDEETRSVFTQRLLDCMQQAICPSLQPILDALRVGRFDPPRVLMNDNAHDHAGLRLTRLGLNESVYAGWDYVPGPQNSLYPRLSISVLRTSDQTVRSTSLVFPMNVRGLSEEESRDLASRLHTASQAILAQQSGDLEPRSSTLAALERDPNFQYALAATVRPIALRTEIAPFLAAAKEAFRRLIWNVPLPPQANDIFRFVPRPTNLFEEASRGNVAYESLVTSNSTASRFFQIRLQDWPTNTRTELLADRAPNRLPPLKVCNQQQQPLEIPLVLEIEWIGDATDQERALTLTLSFSRENQDRVAIPILYAQRALQNEEEFRRLLRFQLSRLMAAHYAEYCPPVPEHLSTLFSAQGELGEESSPSSIDELLRDGATGVVIVMRSGPTTSPRVSTFERTDFAEGLRESLNGPDFTSSLQVSTPRQSLNLPIQCETSRIGEETSIKLSVQVQGKAPIANAVTYSQDMLQDTARFRDALRSQLASLKSLFQMRFAPSPRRHPLEPFFAVLQRVSAAPLTCPKETEPFSTGAAAAAAAAAAEESEAEDGEVQEGEHSGLELSEDEASSPSSNYGAGAAAAAALLQSESGDDEEKK